VFSVMIAGDGSEKVEKVTKDNDEMNELFLARLRDDVMRVWLAAGRQRASAEVALVVTDGPNSRHRQQK
jgi:hypothetical protein